MYGYIYITTNKINGKIYIGQRSGKYDDTYFGSGTLILKAIKKYGLENFENHIIEWCETREQLNVREIYWIKKYNCNAKNNQGYNISIGGNGGNIIEYMNENRKREIIKRRGENISKSLKNKKLTEQHRKSLSLSHKGLPANNAKKVIDNFTNKEYSSIMLAAKDISCDKRAIMKSLKNKCEVKLRDKRIIKFSYL